MPVALITEGLRIQPDHVFIIPSNHDLHVLDGEFHLEPISKPKGWPDVITIFLRSLAQNWDAKLIAVIVSGLDADGSDALREIKAVGGIGPGAVSAQPVLVEVMIDAKAATDLRAAAAEALGRLGKGAAEAVPVLAKTLTAADSPLEVRRAAAFALDQLGPDARPAVERKGRLLPNGS